MFALKAWISNAGLIASFLLVKVAYAQETVPVQEAPTEQTRILPMPETTPDPVTAPGKLLPSEKANGIGDPERIQVTGSRLKRVEAEASAPVTIISSEEIEKSGAASVGDYFRKSASASPRGNFAGTSFFLSAGSSTVNLMGLGPDRTLVLVNGKRLPTLSEISGFNVENIPTALIDRIEILSGGASAIYGADAVGGVVNIITRKDLEGTQVDTYLNVPIHAGGEEYEVSIAQGLKIGESSHISISGGYRHRNPIDKRKRDLAYGFPERQYTVTNAPPGTYSYRPQTADGAAQIGNWTPSSNCPTANQVATVPSSPQDIYCAGFRRDIPVELIPEKEEWYMAGTFDTRLGNWDLSSLLAFSRSTAHANTGHIPYAVDPLTGRQIFLSNSRANELGVIDANNTADLIQLIAPVPEAPNTVYTNTNDSWIASTNLSGDITDNWKADFGLAYSQAFATRSGENIANSEELSRLFVSQKFFGQDPPYVPIDPARDRNLLYGAYSSLESHERSETIVADAFFSSDLVELPGGPLSFGIGAALSGEKFKQTPDPLDTQFNSVNQPLYTGTFADKGEGKRSVASAFSEVSVPLLRQITVDGALRFDHYSDFKNSANYSAGIKLTVIPEMFALRGRTASSFKAPTLSNIHREGGGGYFTVRDARYCEREMNNGRFCDITNPQRSIFIYNPGNKDLDPEVGQNNSLGIILEPLPGLNLIADYYWVSLQDTFKTDSYQAVLDEWYAGHENSPSSGSLRDNTVEVDADGVITKIGLPVQNSGRLTMRMVHAKIDYQTTFGRYRARLNSDYNQTLSFKQQDSEDQPERELVGLYHEGQNGLPRWRWNNFIEFGTDTQSGRLVSRTIAKMDTDPQFTPPAHSSAEVGRYTAYDFVYSLNLPTRAELELGVMNIMDRIGGVSNANDVGSEAIVATSLYDYTGRSIFASVKQKF